jgi:transcriptional regulator with XRE-family HTH domain
MHHTLSTQIKKAREKAGLTQAQLAKKLFVAQNTLGGWETGRHEPKLSYLSEIAEICQVRLTWLLGESMRQPTPQGSCQPFRLLSRESTEKGAGQ